MMKLSFGNMILEVQHFFLLQRQPLGFNGIETSTLDWVEDSIFNDKFDDMFTEYEPFLIDYELEYDVFEFDDLCSTAECLIAFATKSDSPLASLKLKPTSGSLTNSFQDPVNLYL